MVRGGLGPVHRVKRGRRSVRAKLIMLMGNDEYSSRDARIGNGPGVRASGVDYRRNIHDKY